MININYENDQDFNSVWKDRLNEVFEYGLTLLGQTEKFEINLSFVSSEEIKELNRDHRNIDKPTDVLSFPSHDFMIGEVVDKQFLEYALNFNPETEMFMLGDIVICNEVALSQAKELGHTFEQEVVRLAIHSFLHCFGYDHIEDEDYEAMKKMEDEIISKFDYITE